MKHFRAFFWVFQLFHTFKSFTWSVKLLAMPTDTVYGALGKGFSLQGFSCRPRLIVSQPFQPHPCLHSICCCSCTILLWRFRLVLEPVWISHWSQKYGRVWRFTCSFKCESTKKAFPQVSQENWRLSVWRFTWALKADDAWNASPQCGHCLFLTFLCVVLIWEFK